MTVSEDFNFVESEEVLEENSFPIVFGITFTPKILGILVGVLGIAGAAYMLLNMVMPAWDKFQEQGAKVNDIQGQIDQKKASIGQIGEVKNQLASAKKQKIQVLKLFSDENTLDTLLLDLNRIVESSNSKTSANFVRSQLQKFVPVNQKAEIIKDNSYGPLVTGKLKQSTVTIDIVGTFEQTQSILRNIERLQPLLIVKNYRSRGENQVKEEEDKLSLLKPPTINTSFQLQVLMPLNAQESAKTKKSTTQKK
ncbi:pilus assembly protein PilO [Calothrix rhizosoleniae]|uniref:pilus assembly protein PilO n=1 Tax=Calothrix rhizosoleniae TaxID=888997 RepID=UPI000B4985F8|nr:pilus assembly protein PilO [Calothrix rhizosoleniae]